MILTKPQRATLEKGIAAANNVLLRIEFLEQLASVNPMLAERVADLRARRDYLHKLCTTALELDNAARPGSV